MSHKRHMLSDEFKGKPVDEAVPTESTAGVTRLCGLSKISTRVWREGFEAMAKDTDVCAVEFMIPAAREIVLGD